MRSLSSLTAFPVLSERGSPFIMCEWCLCINVFVVNPEYIFCVQIGDIQITVRLFPIVAC